MGPPEEPPPTFRRRRLAVRSKSPQRAPPAAATCCLLALPVPRSPSAGQLSRCLVGCGPVTSLPSASNLLVARLLLLPGARHAQPRRLPVRSLDRQGADPLGHPQPLPGAHHARPRRSLVRSTTPSPAKVPTPLATPPSSTADRCLPAQGQHNRIDHRLSSILIILLDILGR